MATKPRNKMPVSERAKQFMPFAALKGLPEALAAREKITVDKVELSPEREEELDRQMHLLEIGKIATVIHYHKGEYMKTTGMVARIEETSRMLQIVNTRILFEDILEIHFPSSF